MEVEGRHAVEQPERVQVLGDRQRRDLLGALDQRRTESELIHHRNVEPFHQGAGVLAEALLAGDELVAMVSILHLALLQVGREADVVVRGQQQTRAFTLEPVADRGDLVRRRFLLRDQMVEAEHHQGVGVRQDALVDRLLESGLVDALEHRDRMPGDFTGQLLERQGRTVKQLEGPGDALQKPCRGPFGHLVRRPEDAAHLGHGREAVVHLGDVAVGSPRDSSRSSRC